MNANESLVTTKPIPVEVELEEAVPTDAQLEQDLKKHGLVRISGNQLETIRRVGLWVRGSGVVKIQRGAVMIDQWKCDELLDHLRAAMAEQGSSKGRSKVTNLQKIAQAFGYLIKSKAELQRLALEMERGLASAPRAEEPSESVPGFVPGQKIEPRVGTLVMGRTVHMHGNGGQEPTVKP